MEFVERYRSQGSKTGKPVKETRTYPISCANRTWTGWTTSFGTAQYGLVKSCRDYVTPGYWKKKARGEWIGPNLLKLSVDSVVPFGYSDITATVYNPVACTGPTDYYRTEYRGNLFAMDYLGTVLGPESVLDQAETTNLILETRTACLAKRGEGLTNLTETAAELDKTFAMLHSPLGNLRKFLDVFVRHKNYLRLKKLRDDNKDLYSQLRKRRDGTYYLPFRKRSRSDVAREIVTLVTSEWLRFRYGITPLINDVKAVMKVLGETYDIGPKPYTARSSGRLSRNKFEPQAYTSFYYRVNAQKNSVHNFSVRANWTDLYKADPFDKLGLTFRNAVGVVWELTHYSFVYDWMLNIGDLIYANIPKPFVDPKGGTLCYWDSRKTVWVATSVDNLVPADRQITGTYADGVVADSLFKRRDPMEFGTDLVVRTDFRFDNWVRATDAVSLILQRLQGIHLFR